MFSSNCQLSLDLSLSMTGAQHIRLLISKPQYPGGSLRAALIVFQLEQRDNYPSLALPLFNTLEINK